MQILCLQEVCPFIFFFPLLYFLLCQAGYFYIAHALEKIAFYFR